MNSKGADEFTRKLVNSSAPLLSDCPFLRLYACVPERRTYSASAPTTRKKPEGESSGRMTGTLVSPSAAGIQRRRTVHSPPRTGVHWTSQATPAGASTWSVHSVAEGRAFRVAGPGREEREKPVMEREAAVACQWAKRVRLESSVTVMPMRTRRPPSRASYQPRNLKPSRTGILKPV